ncbi:ABC transporter substrate-binding protein [Paraburkholderia elongata]|uniref:ABC transporter substrate-binding protein n=1 Tax=Paraburkholderia elongata TaxID=2675747 RepID=A0A972NK47_9BURK|nr:ABC transporter substrate-binding protein [Paraburkholderia elongata]NPT54918.1 ABC transporter substrate-binding protein [Paraburkholderia elongata]NPT60947.1 ABC transporter substrate-binding protein [Paraburkholderia elongata]
MRRSFRFALAMLACAAASGLAFMSPARAQETVKIGLLFTYSGASGMTGQVADNVIKLFQQKNGTTAGGKKIEFVKRDTTGPNPEVVKRLVQELIVRDKINVLIGPDFTPNVLAVAPLVTEGKVPTFITGAATQGIVARSPYYVRTFFSIPQSVRPIAQWAHENGVKNPFIVVADFAPGHDTETTFTRTFTDLGGRVAGTARVPLRSPEFSSYMQRIKDAQPDAVFAFFPIGELVPQFLKAYADSGLKSRNIKLLGTGDMSDESVIDAAGDASVGLVTAGVYSTAHDSAPNKQFVTDYVAEFGKTPRVTTGSVAVWDAMRLIYDGMAAQKNAPFDADKFMAFVKGRSIESPRGPLAIDRVSGDVTQNVYIRRVDKRDGALQNVEIETFKDVSAK